MRCDMWFGTQDYSQWIPTPQSGADVSPAAWGASGTFLNGQGYAINSRVSHKRFNFSWGTTNARETAQLVKSYFDGSFGTGKIYFVDPLTYTTNILPARWASPSITCDYEGPSLVPGVNPTRVPAPYPEALRLPVAAASYDMTGESPIPSDRNVKAVNLFTNPNLVGDGTWAEVRRNAHQNPGPRTSSVSFGSSWSGATGNVSEVAPSHPSSWSKSGFTYRVTWSSVTAPASGDIAVQLGASLIAAGAAIGDTWTIELSASASPGVVLTPLRQVGETFMQVEAGSRTSDRTMTGEVIREYITFKITDSLVTTHRAGFGVGGKSAGSWVEIAMANLYKGAFRGETSYFDGSTMDSTMPQPEDFRVRWLGPVNASESVMEGERVAGSLVASVNCVSIKSGSGEVRVIRTRTGFAYARLDLNGIEGATTAQVELVRSSVSNPSHPRLFDGNISSPSANMVTSDGKHFRGFTDGVGWNTNRRLILRPGHDNPGVIGDESTYRLPAFFAGDYTGPTFSGDTGRIVVNGQTLITGWQGTPDNSPSEAYFLEPTGNLSKVREQGLYLPIPPGFQLNLGAFYSATGGSNVWVFPALQGGNPGTVATPLTRLDGTERNLFPDVFTNNPGEVGVYLWFGNLETRSASSLRVSAIHARLSPVGSPPQGERMWVGGQGNEGTRFVGPPTYINNTGRNGGQVEFSATFTESVL